MSPFANGSDSNFPHSRRRWLQGVGAALALPLFESSLAAAVSSSRGGAGIASTPARVVYLYVPNGMHMPDYRPRTIGNDF